MEDFETIEDKVAMDCECEDIASQDEDYIHINRFRYKEIEASVHALLKEHGLL